MAMSKLEALALHAVAGVFRYGLLLWEITTSVNNWCLFSALNSMTWEANYLIIIIFKRLLISWPLLFKTDQLG